MGRLRRLLEHRGSDWGVASPHVPLAPYGQHSDPAAALATFQTDLEAVLDALAVLAGGAKP